MLVKRTVYLERMEWKSALQKLREEFQSVFPLGSESVPVIDSLQRISTSDVVARMNSPHYDAAAMDGIAVRAEMTFGASSSKPITLVLGDDCEMVDTGAPIKDGFDAVIKIEDVVFEGDSTAEIRSPVPPGKDIRKTGEDFQKGDVIIPADHIIGAVDIGAMLSCGIVDVEVRRSPSVSIIPTGSEIVEPRENIKTGEIIDCNSYITRCMIQQWGGIPRLHPIVRNDYEEIKRVICNAVSKDDIVIVIAGSSSGSEDFTVSILREQGNVLVHGVDLMPGKPMILARIDDTPVIGLPGYPVSAYVICDIFVREIIALGLGIKPEKKRKVRAILTEDLYSKLGMNEIVRVELFQRNGTLYASPLKRGAGVLSSLVRADGLLIIPDDEEGIRGGREVDIDVINSRIEDSL
jgi:molybdenum cofactor synthesis domain-containing protein